MSWWPPWRRKADDEVQVVLEQAQARLEESEELLARAQTTSSHLRIHLRSNRFGAMIDDEVFGGGHP